MTIMLKILSIIGYILLALIFILLWILIMPRHFWVEYSKVSGISTKMNIGFFKINIWPLPKIIAKHLVKEDVNLAQEQADETVTEETEETNAKKSKPKFLEDIAFSFDLVKDLLKTARGVVRIILKKLRFSDVSFTIPLSADDAYSTQQLYAKTTTAFHGFNMVAQQIIDINYKCPMFVADFADQYTDSTYFYCKITVRSGIIISIAVFAARQFLLITKKHKKPKQTKKEQTNVSNNE